MSYKAPQANFSKGEIAPALYGRFDVDAWKAGLKEATNVAILKYGGLTKRPGFRIVSEAYDGSKPVRLIPFTFSTEQAYALEFGQGYIGPVAFGGRVVEEELAITNIISYGDDARVVAAYHGYEVGDLVYLDSVEGAQGAVLNGRYWPVTAVQNENTFTIPADLGGAAFVFASGGITRTEAPPAEGTINVPPVVGDPDPPPTAPGGGGYNGGFKYEEDDLF